MHADPRLLVVAERLAVAIVKLPLTVSMPVLVPSVHPASYQTYTEHEAPAARLLPHVPPATNPPIGEALGTGVAATLRAAGVEPVFESVNVAWGESVPLSTPPKP